jgi:hypothetical protein
MAKAFVQSKVKKNLQTIRNPEKIPPRTELTPDEYQFPGGIFSEPCPAMAEETEFRLQK